MANLCPDEKIAELMEALQRDGDNIAETDTLLNTYPEDPRLHFMKGSLLAGIQRPFEAHASLARAVELAPDFHLARYQLGFFELTSGEADNALATWGPLLRLPEENYLRQFVEGLTALIRDEFDKAIEHMQKGIALNQENLPLNGDINLLLSQTEQLAAGGQQAKISSETEDIQSATSVMLGQFNRSPTKH